MFTNMKTGLIQQLDSCCSSSVHHAVLQEIDTVVSQADLELLDKYWFVVKAQY